MILENVASASGREDHTQVATWLLRVETKGTKLEYVALLGTGFAMLDCKLAAALTPTVEGELMRRISNAKSKALKIDNQLLAGGQILYMICKPFCTNKNLGLVHTIADLAGVTSLGDDKMETFRNS